MTYINKNACVLYDGPSQINGKRIVVILTGLTRDTCNRKTGKMLQTWILCASRNPVEAVMSGRDEAVCGDCPYRGDGHGRSRACYVNLARGPYGTWKSWQDGNIEDYDSEKHDCFIDSRAIRIGSYGDPAAVPFKSFGPVFYLCSRHTGYTHFWDRPYAARYKDWCMASVGTVEQAIEASKQGWRYYLVTPKDGIEREEWLGHLYDQTVRVPILCPASDESPKKVKCERCALCNGNGGIFSNYARWTMSSVYIPVHGSKNNIASYERLHQGV
jgi:hypothetical protein